MPNVNVGIFGHIDSGKTAFCRTLAEIKSTASMDKSQQSQARGITLDLGFSCFQVGNWQYTLVDCPGHASLLKTVISGAQIVDLLWILIDAEAGVQNQTRECLVLAEILGVPVFIILNKVDLVSQEASKKLEDRLRRTLAKLNFRSLEFFQVSSFTGQGFPDFRSRLTSFEPVDRFFRPDLLLAFDHSFDAKGRGKIFTGTLLAGSLRVNDQVHLWGNPGNIGKKKVKTLQIFRQDVKEARQGDRVALSLADVPQKFERGLITHSPLGAATMVVAHLKCVTHFKHPLISGMKYHLSFLHQHVVGTCWFFENPSNVFDPSESYPYLREVDGLEKICAYIEFPKPIVWTAPAFVVGTKLDLEEGPSKTCRIAFSGEITTNVRSRDEVILRETKTKTGEVNRSEEWPFWIVKDLLKKHSLFSLFAGKPVTILSEPPVYAKIVSTFGQSGKIRVQVEGEPRDDLQGCLVNFRYYKYLFADQKEFRPACD